MVLPRKGELDQDRGAGRLRRSESGFVLGHVLIALLLAVAAGAVSWSVLSGPLALQAKQTALTETVSSSRLAADALAAALANADTDGTLEPLASTDDATMATATGGGGLVPAGVGAPTTDAWGEALGYCAYDHGLEIDASAGRLAGQAAVSGATIVVATISGGPDRAIATTCANAVGGAVAGDDIVQLRSFANAAEIAAGGSGLGSGSGAGTLVVGEASSLACDADTLGTLRRNGTDLEFCDGSTWSPAGSTPGITSDAATGSSLVHLDAAGNVTVTGSLSAASLNPTAPLAVASGGTGASTAAGARTALGLGTLATQDASAVALTGGTIDGITVGGTTPAAGRFTGVAVTAATGTAPFTIASTTTVPNLSADLLDGNEASFFTDASNLDAGTVPTARLPAAGGDLSGTLDSATVGGLQGRAVVATLPTANQALVFNGTSWGPATLAAGSGGQVSLTETDPQVGTVTSGQWCVGAAGGVVNCTAAAPSETDPSVNMTASGALARWSGTELVDANLSQNGSGEMVASVGLVTPYVTYSSDARLKNFEGGIDRPLERLAALSARRFSWTQAERARGRDGRRHVGLVAQEVLEVFPEAVHRLPDGTLSVDYPMMVAPLVAGINELRNEVAALRRELAELRSARGARSASEGLAGR